ncbi:conserved Plasmodium protein, unknown function [Plasmodium sp. gorilla clade G2]|uniref:conserved Plasmodium protein, unknown function n=1 Tax=Plasmodium sp. gorilla clade G2 TaxID=880535 RepID=UPI000D21E2E0|nr:conserved Plasmodium protein, unknown function [Plasmodium sp. gorilla clade G2]SOV13053.1 conserved Plasmodium protein, unknown function [Plasmodium sp. gorilla clade G2]
MVHVLLGYLDEKKKRKNELRDKHKINKKFVSKIGGKPFWLDRINLPDEKEFNCSVCNNMMVFLLQIYAPLDKLGNCFHRCLYVFICIHCGDQAKCFRTQLPRNNPFYNYYLQDSNYMDDPTNENEELIPSDDTNNLNTESDDTDNEMNNNEMNKNEMSDDEMNNNEMNNNKMNNNKMNNNEMNNNKMSDSEENIKNSTSTNNNYNNNNNDLINKNIDNAHLTDMNSSVIFSSNETFNVIETLNSNNHSNSFEPTGNNLNESEETSNNINESDDTTNQINESDHTTNPFNESDDTNNEQRPLEKREKEINLYINNDDNKKDHVVNNIIMNVKEDEEEKKGNNFNISCMKKIENQNCNNKIVTHKDSIIDHNNNNNIIHNNNNIYLNNSNNFIVSSDMKKKDSILVTDYYMTLIKKDKNIFDKSLEYYFCCNICGIPCINKHKKHKRCKLKKHIIFQEHKIYISDEDDCESSSTGSEMFSDIYGADSNDEHANNKGGTYVLQMNRKENDNSRMTNVNVLCNENINTINNDEYTTNNVSLDHASEMYESGDTNKTDHMNNNNIKGNNNSMNNNSVNNNSVNNNSVNNNSVNNNSMNNNSMNNNSVNNKNINNNNINIVDYNKINIYSNTNYSFNEKEQNKEDAEEIDLDISEMKAFEQIQRDIENTRNIDKVFKNYIKKIQRFPSQFIRYSYNGTALYSSCDIYNSNRNNISELPITNNNVHNNIMNHIYNPFNSNNVPRCHICKRRKVFEFQVLSTIINFLTIKKNIQVDNNIALNSKFAYLAIYTCENNCDIFDINNFKESQKRHYRSRYIQEYVYVQVEN